MSLIKDLLFATMKANGEKRKGDFSGEEFEAIQEHLQTEEPTGGGGGAEVKTCTVRIIGGDLNANFEGYYAYSKHENGATSLVEYEGSGGSRFDITLENVLCGSIILFWWFGDTPTIYTDMDSVKPLPTSDSYGATSFYIEETATDCSITLKGSLAGGGDE